MISHQIDGFHQYSQDAGKAENSLEFLAFTRVPYITLNSNEMKFLSTFINHFASFGGFNQSVKAKYFLRFSWGDDL